MIGRVWQAQAAPPMQFTVFRPAARNVRKHNQVGIWLDRKEAGIEEGM